jgi:hypothetical protein
MAVKKIAKKTATRTTRRVRAAANTAADSNPRYLVLQESYIDNVLRKANAEITYFGLPGRALRPINDEARSRKQQVLDIRRDSDLDDEAKNAKLKALSDEWNGVEQADIDDDYELEGDYKKPLPDAERIELEKAASATVESTRIAQEEDTNFTKVKLQGSPDMVETDASKQGATPVTDGRESSKK